MCVKKNVCSRLKKYSIGYHPVVIPFKDDFKGVYVAFSQRSCLALLHVDDGKKAEKLQVTQPHQDPGFRPSGGTNNSSIFFDGKKEIAGGR